VSARPTVGTPRSKPVIKPPAWTWEVPTYFYTGGLAGASAVFAYLAELSGDRELALRAWAVAAGAEGVSPMLLVADLGRPGRFLNMLRMFKITSPMSVGTWVLAISGAATTASALDRWTGLLRPFRPLDEVARRVSAAAGLPLATYTGALIGNTSVPVWHRARHVLPFLFGSSAAASAGGALTALTPERRAASARRVAVGGGVAELMLAQAMERGLGELGENYKSGWAGRLGRASKAFTVAGVGLIAARGSRSRAAAIAGGALVNAGSLCLRWSVFRAGVQSAEDKAQTVGPQRARIQSGETRGAERIGA
jgi:formate-dependent nitrite reductase membrane component NrfD